MLELAGVVAALAVLQAGLGLCSAGARRRIGEGLIYDLRTQVFDHVLQMPIAFFTRTQTGKLVSRLNSDVIGAQQAFTSTLSTVLSNMISLILVLTAMLVLSWQLTVAALIMVPIFFLPARLVGSPVGRPDPPADAVQRRSRRRDDRAVQRQRRAAGQAVRPAADEHERFAEKAGRGPRRLGPDRHERPGLHDLARSARPRWPPRWSTESAGRWRSTAPSRSAP